MNEKSILLLFLLFSTVFCAQAQAVDMIFLNPIEVKAEANPKEIKTGLMGTVYDKETLKPLSGVLISVNYHCDSVIVVHSNIDGKYKIDLNPGVYDVTFIYRDRRDVFKQGVKIKESEYNTEDVFMEVISIDLDKVIIKGTKVIEEKIKK